MPIRPESVISTHAEVAWTEVIVQANGDLILRWKVPAGVIKDVDTEKDMVLKVRLPLAAVPVRAGEKRFVKFLEEGIGLLDENQRPLIRATHRPSSQIASCVNACMLFVSCNAVNRHICIGLLSPICRFVFHD